MCTPLPSPPCSSATPGPRSSVRPRRADEMAGGLPLWSTHHYYPYSALYSMCRPHSIIHRSRWVTVCYLNSAQDSGQDRASSSDPRAAAHEYRVLCTRFPLISAAAVPFQACHPLLLRDDIQMQVSSVFTPTRIEFPRVGGYTVGSRLAYRAPAGDLMVASSRCAAAHGGRAAGCRPVSARGGPHG